VKCYEITKCSESEREQCFVWNSFRENSEDFENVKCWALKGMYHEEDKTQRDKCKKCKYYITLNRETGLATEYGADAAVISCTGVINYEKMQAIEKVWATLKNNKKFRVIFDITNVNMIYSCGLGMLVKLHKETLANHGMLVIVAARDQLSSIFHSIKLTKVLHFAPDKTAAVQYFAAHAQKKEEEARAALEAARRAEEAKQAAIEAAEPKPEPKKFVRCWEYWKNRNP